MISAHAAPYEYVDDLWIVAAYFNPHQYETKFRNFERFMEPIRRSGLNALVVECAFGNAGFQLDRSPGVLQIRAKNVLWQKERLLNVAVEHLPPSCGKVAWLDCDIILRNTTWAVETSNLLDRVPVVQPFTTAVRLPKERQFSTALDTFFTSFCARRQQAPNQSWPHAAGPAVGATGVLHAVAPEIAYCVACGSRTSVNNDCECFASAPAARGITGIEITESMVASTGEFEKHGHTGFGWAARKELLLDPGLYDVSLSGTGDHLMAHAMCGEWSSPCIPRLLGGNQKQMEYFLEWGERMFRQVGGRVGCIAGQIDHLWHGDDGDRNYKLRGWELASFDFDPVVDLRVAANRCWEWNTSKPELHSWCVSYFGLRREDG